MAKTSDDEKNSDDGKKLLNDDRKPLKSDDGRKPLMTTENV